MVGAEKIPPFLNIEVRNQDAQSDIDGLKSEFITERDYIQLKYKKEIDALKEQRRKEMKDLKRGYYGKFESLSEKYPDVKNLKVKKKDPSLKDKDELDKRRDRLNKKDPSLKDKNELDRRRDRLNRKRKS